MIKPITPHFLNAAIAENQRTQAQRERDDRMRNVNAALSSAASQAKRNTMVIGHLPLDIIMELRQTGFKAETGKYTVNDPELEDHYEADVTYISWE